MRSRVELRGVLREAETALRLLSTELYFSQSSLNRARRGFSSAKRGGWCLRRAAAVSSADVGREGVFAPRSL